MKKILLMLMMCFSFMIANAQIATENRKVFDNVYVGVEAGATTPLNFNPIFPVNPVVGIKIGKEFTPIFGFEVEGLAVFGDNFYRYGRETSTVIWYQDPFNIHKDGSINTFVKATNLGLNSTINWSNLLCGYKGTPRIFEVKTNIGLGWLHYFGTYTPDRPIGAYKINSNNDALTAKTAIDLAFNIGKKRAHTIALSPGVYWNLSETGDIKFHKSYAQLGIMLGYVYHFKTSNGTHHFRTYNVGAMNAEINRLNKELAKKPTEVEVIKYVEVIKTDTVRPNIAPIIPTYVIQFAKNSADLNDDAKAILNNVNGNVNITAYASPEGTKEYNQKLSEKRAAVVADYLTKRNVKVNSSVGVGCENENSNRIAIVTGF